MTRARRTSPQTAAVLGALAVEPARWRYGYELGQEVGLKAGSLYPILIRLCDRGMLAATWESDPPKGRPPRHLYRLTDAGVATAAEVAANVKANAEAMPPAARTRPAGTELRGAW